MVYLAPRVEYWRETTLHGMMAPTDDIIRAMPHPIPLCVLFRLIADGERGAVLTTGFTFDLNSPLTASRIFYSIIASGCPFLDSQANDMATLQGSRISRLKALLIDDMSGMRTNLRTQLQQLGINDVAQAASAKDALKTIAARASNQPFDLVLCDYNLGNGTNGQQLLEHVREKNLLLPVTIWFMITAESGYDNVATASNYAPDDYLIKPFTAANLESRLLRHFERQDELEPALKRMTAGDLQGAAIDFKRLAEGGSKFTMDALRLQARCLTTLHRHDEAKAVFSQALSIRRQVPWAELGFARAMHDSGDVEKAHAAAVAIAAANPKLVGAQEFLAEIHESRGEELQALEALRKAESIVPSASRTRALGEMAMRVGDLELAKTAYAKVVAATHNSITKSPYDSAALAQVYVDTGDSAKALELLKPAQQAFADDMAFQAIAAAVEALAYQGADDDEAAGAALERALSLVSHTNPQAALAVSKACFAMGKDADGERVVTAAVRADHEDAQLVAAAKRVLKNAGKEHVSERIVDSQVRDILRLTEQALAMAKQAQLVEAQTMVEEAATGLPRNVGVLVAAAQINLLVLSQQGLDVETTARVRRYLETLDTLAPGTERVVKMGAFFRELLLKARTGTAT